MSLIHDHQDLCQKQELAGWSNNSEPHLQNSPQGDSFTIAKVTGSRLFFGGGRGLIRMCVQAQQPIWGNLAAISKVGFYNMPAISRAGGF